MPLPKCTKTLAELKKMKKYKTIKGRSSMDKAQLCRAMGYSVPTKDTKKKSPKGPKPKSPAKKSPAKKKPAKKKPAKKSPAKKKPAKKPKASPAQTILGRNFLKARIEIKTLPDGSRYLKVNHKPVPRAQFSRKLFRANNVPDTLNDSLFTPLSDSHYMGFGKTEHTPKIMTGNMLIKSLGLTKKGRAEIQIGEFPGVGGYLYRATYYSTD